MLSTLTHCCYRHACTQSSALVVVVVELRATACCCFLCDDGLMAPKRLRLRSSSQMREVNTDGAARGGVWLRSSVCVRAIGTRCRRGVNRQGSEVENLARVTPRCVRDADGSDRQICSYEIETQFCKLRIDRDVGKKTSQGFHLISFRYGDHTSRFQIEGRETRALVFAKPPYFCFLNIDKTSL